MTLLCIGEQFSCAARGAGLTTDILIGYVTLKPRAPAIRESYVRVGQSESRSEGIAKNKRIRERNGREEFRGQTYNNSSNAQVVGLRSVSSNSDIWPLERPEGMPAIQSLEVMCGKDHMDVHLSFSQPFEGIVSSKGQHADPRCIYVSPSTGQTFFSFRIAYARYVSFRFCMASVRLVKEYNDNLYL